MRGLLSVIQAKYIKELREVKGLSVAKISAMNEITWKTAKKYADEDVNLEARPRQRRRRRVMEGFTEYVDAWLEEDMQNRRKDRLTAKAIYELLCELGFTGSDRTVRDYVKEQKEVMVAARKQASEQFIRLEHPCGEAQVDFGEFRALDPVSFHLVKWFVLAMSFPQSNNRLARILPAQNSECLLYGLVSMFDEMGGVPPFLLFDNLRPVVRKLVSHGERDLTDTFLEFQRRFGFACKFAAPGKGNEKGSVENAVQYVRNNHLKPLLVLDDIDAANDRLRERLLEDLDQLHYEKQVPVATLWEGDRKTLLPLPSNGYIPMTTMNRTVNKYGEIRIDKEMYHLPTASPKQSVFVQVGWDRVHVYDRYGEQELAVLPRAYMHKTEAIDWVSTLRVYENRPRALEQGMRLKALPKVVRSFLLPEDLSERRGRVQTVMTLLADYDVDTVASILTTADTYQVTSTAELKMLGQNLLAGKPPTPIADPWTPLGAAQWEPNLASYDSLAPKGGPR